VLKCAGTPAISEREGIALDVDCRIDGSPMLDGGPLSGPHYCLNQRFDAQ